MAGLTHFPDEGFNRFEVDAPITVAGKLHICLLQLAPAKGAIEADTSRPAAVNAITHLISGGDGHANPALDELVPGNDPVLVVLPEYALASGDWAAVDAAIRGAHRMLVVVAGFGATRGQTVLEWATGETGAGDTIRVMTWDQENPERRIVSARPINGGWCWIHAPDGATHCLVHLKGSAEQNKEAVQLAHLQFGRDVTHVRFADVDLFPLICADMLTPQAGHPDSMQARMARALAPPSNRPAMAVASLLQEKFNFNWQAAINSVLNQVFAGRPGVVSLCNSCFDKPVKDETDDRWRCLTGVFGQLAMLKRQSHLPCGRSVIDHASGTVGAVVRHTEAMAVCGIVDFSPEEPLRKFLFHAEMQCPLGPGGMVAPIPDPPCHFAYELARFLRRHPPKPNWSTRVADGAKGLAAHFKNGAKPLANQVLGELLNGVSPRAIVDPDELHQPHVELATEDGLNALATLATLDGVEWQPHATQSGQLRQPAMDRHLLVWRDPDRTARQMESELGAWRVEVGDHPNLIVLGEARYGPLKEGVVGAARRDTISSGPSAGEDLALGGGLSADPKDISQPRVSRNVAVVPLAAVTTMYTDHGPGEDDAVAVEALFARLNVALVGGAPA